MKKDGFVFIVTSGRCGTVFVSDALSRCPGVTSKHERYSKFLRFLQNIIKEEKPDSFAGRIGELVVCRKLESLAVGRAHFEVNLTIRSFVKSVGNAFPETPFVHMVRDPREHVASGVNWGEQHLFNRWFKLYVPFWSPRPPSSLNLGTSQRDRLFALAAWNWYIANEAYARVESISSNYFRLYFEDLKEDPLQFLNRLLDIAGYERGQVRKALPSIVTKADRNASHGSFPPWPDWSDRYVRVLDKICGPLMAHFGYGQEREWLERLGQ